MMGVASGAGTTCPSRAHVFSGVSVAQSLVFCGVL